jgi:hypothetical protein
MFLSKEEAIEAMKGGAKVSHRCFTEEEWMKWDAGYIVFEDGCQCTITEFFRIRTGEAWADGYRIIGDA